MISLRKRDSRKILVNEMKKLEAKEKRPISDTQIVN